jgi:hypothetical protein
METLEREANTSRLNELDPRGLVDEVLDFLFLPHIGAHKFGFSAEVAQFSG